MRNVFPHEVSFANITLLYQYAMFRPLQLITIGKSTISIYYLSDQKRFHMTVGTTLLLEFTKKKCLFSEKWFNFFVETFCLVWERQQGRHNKTPTTITAVPATKGKRWKYMSGSLCLQYLLFSLCSSYKNVNSEYWNGRSRLTVPRNLSLTYNFFLYDAGLKTQDFT